MSNDQIAQGLAGQTDPLIPRPTLVADAARLLSPKRPADLPAVMASHT